MKVLSFINLAKKEHVLYKKCLESQQEWADFHNIEFERIEYLEHSNQKMEWNAYLRYMQYMLDLTEDIGDVVMILPSVLILEKHKDLISFDDFPEIVHGMSYGLCINSLEFPSIFKSRKETHENIIEIIEESFDYSKIKHSMPMLSVAVILMKTHNYVRLLDGVTVGMPYIQGISTGMEMHLDTNKEDSIHVSYSPRELEDPQFYKPGDFAVNVGLCPNKNLIKGYIKEFLYVKKQVDKIMSIGTYLEKDLNEKSDLGS